MWGDEHFRRGRNEWVGCYERGAKGREQTDWETAEGEEKEGTGCILEIIGGEEGGGVDGLGLGVMGVGAKSVRSGGGGEEIRGSELRMGLVWRR